VPTHEQRSFLQGGQKLKLEGVVEVLAVHCNREGAFTEEDALRVGREAGEQLKAEAGPEFMTWSH
jgi:hypothetical protein